MPVQKNAQGKSLEVFFHKETAYGIAPTGNYAKTPVYSLGLRANRPLEADPILGVAQQNTRDSTAPAPGLTSHSGDTSVGMDLRHIGHWLGLVLGSPLTTEVSDVFTHVFVSGKADIPSWTVVQKLTTPDGTEFRRHVGVVGRTLQFALGQEAGFRKVNIGMGGRNEAVVGMAGTGTVPDMLDMAPLPASKGVLKRNGVVVGNLLGFDATYDNAFEEERLVDEGDQVSGWGPGDAEASCTGTFTLRYKGTEYDALGENGTPQVIAIEYTLSPTLKLVIALPSVTFERAGLPISGPGRIEQQVGFRAAQTGSAPMLTITLTNDVEDYSEAA